MGCSVRCPPERDAYRMTGTVTKVKICGLQDVEVLKSLLDIEVDYIGYVFAPSRRRISADRAAELSAVLKQWRTEKRPLAVGVFVNPDHAELDGILAEVPLAVVQLHGEESPAFCREVGRRHPGVQVWKALSVAADGKDGGGSAGDGAEEGEAGVHASADHAPAGIESGGLGMLERYAGAVDAVLLDTLDPGMRGGSGKTFAWERIPAYQERAAELGLPLFIAGGLSPDNVRELTVQYSPYGVDVSSGVESEGAKDIAKIITFVERVKGA